MQNTLQSPNRKPDATYGFAPETIPLSFREPKVGIKTQAENKQSPEQQRKERALFSKVGIAVLRFFLNVQATEQAQARSEVQPRPERKQVMPAGFVIEAPPPSTSESSTDPQAATAEQSDKQATSHTPETPAN